MKKYKAKDLNIHIYGNGRNKKFIMYTDYEYQDGIGPRWHKRVYPDIEGNKAKAVKQALKWLNDEELSNRFAVFTNPTKIFIAYDGPSCFSETDNRGLDLHTYELLY